MKYNDYIDPETEEKWVNGKYVGVRIGTPLGDATNPASDGYDHIRESKHIGTMLGDAAAKIEFEVKEE